MPELEIKEEPISPTLAKKSEVDAKAEELKAARALPVKPGDNVAFVELKRWLDLLDDTQLRRLNIYVYRNDPIINMQIVDPESDNNIDIFYDINKQSVKDINEDYFIEKHGGGRYKFLVKDLDKPKVQKGGFFEATLYISMTMYPPKIPDLRVVEWDNPRNKGFKTWCRGQKLIDEACMPVLEKKTEAPVQSNDAMVQAMKLAMDFASKMDDKQQNQLKRQLGAEDTLGKSIGDILLEKMKQDDPNKQVATLTTLISAMKGMQPEQIKPSSELATVMPLLIAMMQSGKDQTALLVESMRSQQTLLIEMMKGNGKEQGDDTERLKNLLEIAKMMKGGGTVAEDKPTLTESLVESLPSVLQIVGNVTSLFAQQRGVGAIPANVGPVPSSSPMDAANRANAQAMANQPNGAPGLPAPMTDDQKRQAFAQLAPLVVQALASGKEGYEFAEDMERFLGPPAIAMIIKDGVQPLVNVARTVPEWQGLIQTYGEPHLVNWVTMFVNYKAELAKMEALDAKEEGE